MSNLPATVSLSPGDGHFPIYVINHPRCKAQIALHGAHILSWQPTSAEEVLYLSPETHFKEGKAIRGGIPLCWPWFNAHATDPEMPSHGFARTRFWELEEVMDNDQSVRFRFRTQWRDLVAVVEIILGETLKLSFNTKNVGQTIGQVGGALHSYFLVGDISTIAVRGLENCNYLDTVGGRVEKQQQGEIYIDQEIDSIFRSEGMVKIIDPLMKRVIVIEKCDAPSTVVWNPWIAKAQTLSDLPDLDYRKFLCVEPAITHPDAVILAAGESHSFSTKISVQAI